MDNNEDSEIEKLPDFKRLNVDIPEGLFRILKQDCYIQGVTVSDFIRGLLMERFEKKR